MAESPFSSPPVVGTSSTASLVASLENAARAVGSGSFDVLATPALAALMEKASCQALNPFLTPGWTSVGTLLNLAHSAPTLPGAKVEATATITAVEGREVRFDIKAFDGSGQVGSCEHARVAVSEAKFLDRAKRRAESPSG